MAQEVISTEAPPPAEAGPPTARRVSGRSALLLVMRNALPVGFAILIGLFVALGAPNFLTLPNFSDILRLSAPIMVVAIPMAFLLIMGHVDLSVGSTIALSAVVLGLLMRDWGLSPLLAVPLGALGIGVLIGVMNGTLVTRVGLSPIIVTLGTLTAIRGFAMWLAPFPVFGFPRDFVQIAYTGVFGIPYLVIGAAVVVAIGAFVLALSAAGRHVLAIGVNEEAAFLSGISVKRTILAGYIATAAMAGFAGAMYASLLNSAPAGSLGVGNELSILTAVLLGGVSFNGGRGTIRGVVLGVLFLAVLQNGLTLMNVPAAGAGIIQGLALVVAAGLDLATQKAESRVKGR